MEQYRQAVAELKDLVNGDVTKLKDQSADFTDRFVKINAELDRLELEVKKRPSGAGSSPEQKNSEVYETFGSMIKDFATGNRHELNTKYAEKSKGFNRVAERKSENMVRFDFQSTGALLFPDLVVNDIIKDITESTPVLQVARVTTVVNNPALVRRARTSTPGGRWLEEENPTVKGKNTYKTIRIPTHKWASEYGMTIENELHSNADLVSEVMEAFREDFAVDLGGAFVNGDGNGKPKGIISGIDNYDSGGLALSSDMLIQLQAQLKDAYQNGASWMFNRFTRAKIRTVILAAGSDLNGAWEVDLTKRNPTLLLGSPIVTAAPSDIVGTVKGNFTAGEVPILYGDFRQAYEVAFGRQMYLIDDPYSDASTFVRNLHIMNMVGGGPIKSEAAVKLTITS